MLGDITSDSIIGLIGFLIGVLGTLVVQRVVLRQRAHEIYLTSQEHLGGGSQERNLGITALEFHWDEYKSEQKLIVPLMVGAAIYLLTESKQGDVQHERYNLKRIMDLLLDKYKIGSSVRADSSIVKCSRDLHKALWEWNPEGRAVEDKGKIVPRGLLIERELVGEWKARLESNSPNFRQNVVRQSVQARQAY